MAVCKRKVVVFLITIALGGGALVVCTSRAGGDGPEKENPQVKVQNSRSTAGSLFASDPNLSARADSNFSSGEMFFKLMLSVVLVGVLGAAAIYASRKLLPRITNLRGKKIRVVETAYLGPRKAVHIVQIGNQQFLIGSTNENVTKLADVTFAFTDLSARETDDNLET